MGDINNAARTLYKTQTRERLVTTGSDTEKRIDWAQQNFKTQAAERLQRSGSKDGFERATSSLSDIVKGTYERQRRER